MKKEQVQIGQVYRAKVTDKVVPVRIEKENPQGGWDAINLHTHRPVRIKSAQRLRGRVPVPGDDTVRAADAVQRGNLADGITVPTRAAKNKLTKEQRDALRAQTKADQANARLRDEREASPDGMTASERAMAESAKDNKADHPATKPRKQRDGLSCLDAAAKVLAEAGEPMNTKAMVEAMMAKGYWTTDAPTPAATLYSAILRELQKKGDDARFTKVERGKFTLASEGKED